MTDRMEWSVTAGHQAKGGLLHKDVMRQLPEGPGALCLVSTEIAWDVRP